MRFITTFLCAFAISSVHAQNSFPTTGNAGINTNNPIATLQINKSNVRTDPASTPTTVDNLLVLQTPYQGSNPPIYNGTGYKWGIQFWGKTESPLLDQLKSGAIYAVSEDGEMGYNRAVGLAFHTSGFDKPGTEQMRITSAGNVGIGTFNTKGYKLAVAGSVIATSVTVKVLTAWPDYVFQDDYHLPSLTDVKQYIALNKHLPDLPSANKISSEGLDLGNMNILLTKKIEELTLYVIEKDNELKKQQAQIEQLKVVGQQFEAQQSQLMELQKQFKIILEKGRGTALKGRNDRKQ